MSNASSVTIELALQPLKNRSCEVVYKEMLSRPSGMSPEVLAVSAPWEVLSVQVEFVKLTGLTGILLNIEPELLNTTPTSALMGLLSPVVSQVALEVTERGELDDQAAGTLAVFCDHGGEVWLDDFGTGSSTLEHRGVLVDAGLISGVKLPMGCAVEPLKKVFPRGTRFVQEGVETAGQLAEAFEAGVDLVQGWWVGLPETQPARITVPGFDPRKAGH